MRLDFCVINAQSNSNLHVRASLHRLQLKIIILNFTDGLKMHGWIHLRNEEFYTKRPDLYDNVILVPLIQQELVAIRSAAKKL